MEASSFKIPNDASNYLFSGESNKAVKKDIFDSPDSSNEEDLISSFMKNATIINELVPKNIPTNTSSSNPNSIVLSEHSFRKTKSNISEESHISRFNSLENFSGVKENILIQTLVKEARRENKYDLSPENLYIMQFKKGSIVKQKNVMDNDPEKIKKLMSNPDWTIVPKNNGRILLSSDSGYKQDDKITIDGEEIIVDIGTKEELAELEEFFDNFISQQIAKKESEKEKNDDHSHIMNRRHGLNNDLRIETKLNNKIEHKAVELNTLLNLFRTGEMIKDKKMQNDIEYLDAIEVLKKFILKTGIKQENIKTDSIDYGINQGSQEKTDINSQSLKLELHDFTHISQSTINKFIRKN